MNNSTVKAIVFDLDGTLYEDTHHFNFFANCIEDKLPNEKKPIFRKDYSLSLHYEHPLQIGRVYDVQKDLILVQQNEQVIAAYKWDGNQLSEDKIKQLYPTKISFNQHSMINIGDLWWVPIAIAAHYGLEGQKSQQAFLETRDYMMSDCFEMNPIPELKTLLESLHNHLHISLLTNSPEPDSEAILNKLGIQHLFHRKIFNGKKPTLTQDWFAAISKECEVDYPQILSIGDNEMNEIKPVHQLGCKTIYIDTHEVGDSTSADYVVPNMSQAIPIIQLLTTKS